MALGERKGALHADIIGCGNAGDNEWLAAARIGRCHEAARRHREELSKSTTWPTVSTGQLADNQCRYWALG